MTKLLDCGDNGCYFKVGRKPGGLGTNACRCIPSKLTPASKLDLIDRICRSLNFMHNEAVDMAKYVVRNVEWSGVGSSYNVDRTDVLIALDRIKTTEGANHKMIVDEYVDAAVKFRSFTSTSAFKDQIYDLFLRYRKDTLEEAAAVAGLWVAHHVGTCRCITPSPDCSPYSGTIQETIRGIETL
jgi:hypothetical protein